jgi:hypothetical protein
VLDELQPPAFFTASQREFFRQAVRSRPGYWIPADVILLESYAICADYVRQAHSPPPGVEITPAQYAKAGRELRTLMRELRLSPYSRDVSGEEAVAEPAGTGLEGAAAWSASSSDAAPQQPAWTRDQADDAPRYAA